MAQRKTARKKTSKTGRMPLSMVFWLLFFVVLISLFFVFLSVVKGGLKNAGITPPARQTATEKPKTEELAVQEQKPQTKPPAAQEQPAEKKPETKPPTTPEKPAEKPPAKPEQPATQPPATQEQRPPEPAVKPPETRDRTVYFVRDDAALTLVKSARKLAVSDSPLFDCVNALLAGPTADEKNRGLISFIPSNSRLINARMNGSTAHLNFNEEFRYNTGGREGSEAQLRQIVWTATEFPNVNNVQIEIEGKTVDFLVEGIAIRSPIGR